MNVTEQKYISYIENIIPVIQEFVSKHIKNGNAMTAAKVYEGFSKETKCDISEDDFIKGFRVAVREGLIKGIIGAKRAGYKAIGDTVTPKQSANPCLEAIEEHLETIQEFIDKNIQGEVRMTAAAIHSKVKCGLDEVTFVNGFRAAIKEGKITGLESAYRLGYKRAEESSDEEEESESQDDSSCEIMIGNKKKMVPIDRHNWAYMERRGSGTWSTEGYFPNTKKGLIGIASKVLDSELRNSPSISIAELEKRITQAEASIAQSLEKVINS
jgi:hypothetical protein